MLILKAFRFCPKPKNRQIFLREGQKAVKERSTCAYIHPIGGCLIYRQGRGVDCLFSYGVWRCLWFSKQGHFLTLSFFYKNSNRFKGGMRNTKQVTMSSENVNANEESMKTPPKFESQLNKNGFSRDAKNKYLGGLLVVLGLAVVAGIGILAYLGIDEMKRSQARAEGKAEFKNIVAKFYQKHPTLELFDGQKVSMISISGAQSVRGYEQTYYTTIDAVSKGRSSEVEIGWYKDFPNILTVKIGYDGYVRGNPTAKIIETWEYFIDTDKLVLKCWEDNRSETAEEAEVPADSALAK